MGRLHSILRVDPSFLPARSLSVGKGRTKIRNRIRELRAAAGDMTQAELAERIGVTRQTVIAMEQGKYSPSLEVAFRTALALGVRLEDVFQYGAEDTP